MQAGLLRKRLTIQKRSQTQDDYGQPLLVWTDVASVWGELTPQSGSESSSADSVIASQNYQVTIRYYPGVTEKMRIKYNNRIMDIQNVLNENERNRTIILSCVEGLSDG